MASLQGIPTFHAHLYTIELFGTFFFVGTRGVAATTAQCYKYWLLVQDNFLSVPFD